MKSVWTNLKNVIIVILIGWLVFEKQCTPPCPEIEPCPEFDTTGFLATLPTVYPDTAYVPQLVYQDTGSTKWLEKPVIPIDIDSLAIALAYFGYNIHLDSISKDTNLLLVIRDSVSQNKIMRREILDFVLYPRYTIVTKTVIEPYVPRNKVFLGLGIGGWTDKFGIMGSFMFVTKKENAYQLSGDPINRMIYGTAHWKIKTKWSK